MCRDAVIGRLQSGEEASLVSIKLSTELLLHAADVIASAEPRPGWRDDLLGNLGVVELEEVGEPYLFEAVIPVVPVDEENRPIQGQAPAPPKQKPRCVACARHRGGQTPG